MGVQGLLPVPATLLAEGPVRLLCWSGAQKGRTRRWRGAGASGGKQGPAAKQQPCGSVRTTRVKHPVWAPLGAAASCSEAWHMATLESACSSSHARHDETVAEARGKGKLPLAPGRAAPDPHLCTVSSVTDLLDRAGCSLAGWLCSRWERLLTGFAAALRLIAGAAANLSSACSRHHAVQQVHMHPRGQGEACLLQICHSLMVRPACPQTSTPCLFQHRDSPLQLAPRCQAF